MSASTCCDVIEMTVLERFSGNVSPSPLLCATARTATSWLSGSSCMSRASRSIMPPNASTASSMFMPERTTSARRRSCGKSWREGVYETALPCTLQSTRATAP